jgi:Flp pilus assembly pilin Flp
MATGALQSPSGTLVGSRGQGVVEYGLLLGLTSALTAIWLLVFGGAIADALAIIGEAIDRATGG